MRLSDAEVDEWAATYIAFQQLPQKEQQASDKFWATERFMCPAEPEQAEDCWRVILEVLSRKPPPRVIGMLAAGALEDLIDDWGAMFIDRMELEARRSPAFRHLLGGVWESGPPEVWERVKSARGAVW
jgi:hypothetical protein